MVYDPKTDEHHHHRTNLSASPVDGDNAAVVLAKAVIATLYGSSVVPGGDPAGPGAESSDASP